MERVICTQCSKIINNKKIIDAFSYTFKNHIYFLKGENGSGKSTLLRLFTKIEKISSGKMQINAKNILYLTNDGVGQKFLTIQENIELLFAIHGVNYDEKAKTFVSSMFTFSQLNELYEVASLGMTLKVGCSLLGIDKYWELIMIDETLSGIDKESRQKIISRLERLVNKETVCIIIVSHNEIEKEFLGSYQIIYLEVT